MEQVDAYFNKELENVENIKMKLIDDVKCDRYESSNLIGGNFT